MLYTHGFVKLVQKRTNFFVSNPLMIPKNKLSLTPSIKTALSNIHDTYVLVPADKAANNVIIVWKKIYLITNMVLN